MRQLVVEQERFNLKLKIVGTGTPDYINHLEKLIIDHHLQDFIKLTGFIKRSKLITIYSRANILLFPSLSWEGMGVTILEAMARGLVVIASDIGGPKDIIEDGKDGFLVSPNAPHEIVKIIDELITSPKLLQEIGQAALKKVREKYQLSDMLASYQGVIEEWYIKENVQTHSRKNGRKSAHFNNY